MKQIKTRKFEDDINNWYQNNADLALIIRGARQVGKTTSILNWAFRNHINMLTINFFEEPSLISIFTNASSVNEILNVIKIKKNIDINKLDVIFLDEIQVDGNLLYTTRLFKNHRIKLICSGSLLGLNLLNEVKRTDVGSKLYLDVYPLDFEEFLLWTNNEIIVNQIKEAFNTWSQIMPIIHQHILKLYNDYLLVGGMPRSVIEYVSNNNTINENIYQIKKAILQDYITDNHDIVKISDNYTKTNLKIANLIYEKIEQFIIQKNNKRFIIDTIGKNYRYRNIMIPLDILKKVNIVMCCNNVDAIHYPLSMHLKESFFKLYYSDVGLLTQRLKINTDSITSDKIKDLLGGIIENAVVCNLRKENLYYWSEKINGNIYEIDLLLEDKKTLDIIPIEIKSNTSAHKKSKSLLKYSQKYRPKKVYCVGFNNFAIHGDWYYLPVYAVFLLRDQFK